MPSRPSAPPSSCAVYQSPNPASLVVPAQGDADAERSRRPPPGAPQPVEEDGSPERRAPAILSLRERHTRWLRGDLPELSAMPEDHAAVHDDPISGGPYPKAQVDRLGLTGPAGGHADLVEDGSADEQAGLAGGRSFDPLGRAWPPTTSSPRPIGRGVGIPSTGTYSSPRCPIRIPAPFSRSDLTGRDEESGADDGGILGAKCRDHAVSQPGSSGRTSSWRKRTNSEVETASASRRESLADNPVTGRTQRRPPLVRWSPSVAALRRLSASGPATMISRSSRTSSRARRGSRGAWPGGSATRR